MSAYIRGLVARKRAAEANEARLLIRQEAIIAAAKGADGHTPAHEWKGSKLRFEKPDGTWGEWVDLRGKPGKDGKSGTVVVGGGGARFDPSTLPIQDTPRLDDYLVLERDGFSYRVEISTVSALCGGGVIPATAVRVGGEAVTLNGDYVTVT